MAYELVPQLANRHEFDLSFLIATAKDGSLASKQDTAGLFKSCSTIISHFSQFFSLLNCFFRISLHKSLSYTGNLHLHVYFGSCAAGEEGWTRVSCFARHVFRLCSVKRSHNAVFVLLQQPYCFVRLAV